MKNIVIVPTYNEKENISAIISAVMGLDIDFDILIIDDNSPDGTSSIVKNLQKENSRLFLIEREGKLGLGSAYLTGFKWALEHRYDTISEMDADFSHNPNDLLRLYRAIAEEGADVAIGSRYIKGINVVDWSLSRILLSYGASLYVRFITNMKVKDTTAGFVCYRATALSKIIERPIDMVGYGFQIEMKYLAWKLGFKIREISIIFTDRKLGSSKMSGGIFSEALLGVIKMRFKSK